MNEDNGGITSSVNASLHSKVPSIRTLTYKKANDMTNDTGRKWKHPKDEVFDRLGALFEQEPHKQVMVSDFLNLFYYFIICYSKTCFKKECNWGTGRWHPHSRQLSTEIIFHYQVANELESHQQLLEIQSKMYQYRQEYELAINQCHNDIKRVIYNYFTDAKNTEIMQFIDEGLEKLCSDIQEPVMVISDDIKKKIAKYKKIIDERKKMQKSDKINYAALERAFKHQDNTIESING